MQLEPGITLALRVGGIVLTALALIWLVRIGIGAAVRELLERRAEQDESDLTGADMERRTRTIQRLAARIATAVIAGIALLMVFDQLGMSIGPAIAGLGVVGIAVGFGAQTIIRDWLAGVFIVLENQFSAGDIVQVAGVTGTVEDFSLRRTTLRDLDGTLHSVPNGEITVASNMTRGWARVNLDVSVAYDTDIDHATAIIDAVGLALSEDAAWKDRIVEPPTVVRVNDLADSGVALKVLGQVRPAEQWAVTGELRKRVLAAFSAEGIEIPFPHRVMISREPGTGR